MMPSADGARWRNARNVRFVAKTTRALPRTTTNPHTITFARDARGDVLWNSDNYTEHPGHDHDFDPIPFATPSPTIAAPSQPVCESEIVSGGPGFQCFVCQSLKAMTFTQMEP